MAVGGDNKKFISIASVNIVVAANAGGAFSPFGDITTLMVWQKGVIPFLDFFSDIFSFFNKFCSTSCNNDIFHTKGAP